MNVLSPPLAVRPREEQFVGDLGNLFRRHRVRTGSVEYLELLAPMLQANRALRSDLLMLCNAISRLSETELEPEELLQLVARAVALRTVDGEIAIPAELRDSFLTGWREWQARADSLSELYWGELGTRGSAGEQVEALRPAEVGVAARFSTAQTLAGDRNTPAAQSTGEITPETRLGELTLSQLRDYLQDVEQRISVLQPLPSIREKESSASLSKPGDTGIAERGATPAIGRHEIGRGQVPAREAIQKTDVPRLEVKAEREPDVVTVGPKKHESLRLVLRDEPQGGNDGEAILGAPALFHSVSQTRNGRSRGLLWLGAALLLLLPASYYGKRNLYPPAASMPLNAPPMRTSVAPAPAGDPTTRNPTVPRAKPIRPPKVGAYFPPRAVQMEAEAARAEQHDSGEKLK